ncbi:hypothetical protein, partial [Glaesserella parasuis]|uniref:hypothetical protein n=1 Tax=Glaesserella parasuis TaxID=738 RepID=UPI003F3424EE
SAEQFGITYSISVKARVAGPRLGKAVQDAIWGAKNGSWERVLGTVTITGRAGSYQMEEQEYETVLNVAGIGSGEAIDVLPGGGFVLLDTVTTP